MLGFYPATAASSSDLVFTCISWGLTDPPPAVSGAGQYGSAPLRFTQFISNICVVFACFDAMHLIGAASKLFGNVNVQII